MNRCKTNRIPAPRLKTDTPNSNGIKMPIGKSQVSNEVVLALRNSAAKERELEEKRLKKRQNRANGDTSKPNSSVPGTPGSVAPDPLDKPITKKALKKQAETKASEAATHAAANTTLAQFSGGSTKNMFGKKKNYSWMNKATGSGASTPARLSTGIPLTPGAPAEPPVAARLTADPARRIGQWREDAGKGNGLQLRDWVAALESDGHAKRSLQKAYLALDQSEPK